MSLKARLRDPGRLGRLVRLVVVARDAENSGNEEQCGCDAAPDIRTLSDEPDLLHP